MTEQRMVPAELLKDCLREAGYVENYGLIKRIRALLDGPGVEPIEITAGMVKELRDRTDAPMLECKKALAAARGDMVKAAKILTVYPYRAVTPALMIPDAAIDAARSGGNMTKCLFVHGDYDGEMLDVNHNFPYYLMPRRTHAGAPFSGSEVITKAQQKQSYARHEICDVDNRCHVVYISGGNQLAPILEIIQGYARLAKELDNAKA